MNKSATLLERKMLHKKRRHFIIPSIAVFSLLLFILGYWFLRNEFNELKKENYNQLHIISSMNVSQISNWRKERLADVLLQSRQPYFNHAIRNWMADRDEHAHLDAIELRLNLVVDALDYDRALLATTDGNVLVSTGAQLTELTNTSRDLIKKVAASNEAEVGSFYRVNQNETVYIDMAAPIIDNDGEMLAVLLLSTNPENNLYPIIQLWAVISRTAESVLIGRDNDEIVFLNRLRHIAAPPLTMKMPVTERENPSVRAVLGDEGRFEGMDYRGEEVLAVLASIPDSPWYLIAKVDEAEILMEARSRAMLIGIMILLFIGTVILLLAVVLTKRDKELFEDLYMAEGKKLAVQAEIQATLYSIGDAVITTDLEGKITRMNPVAEKLTEWSELEAKGKYLNEIFYIINEKTREAVESPADKIFEDGCIVELANHTLLISRNGSEIPIADSGAPIKDENDKMVGVVLVFRDQTKEREARRKLMESEALLKIAGKLTKLGGWSADINRNKVIWSDEVAAIHDMPGGYSPTVEEGINFYAPECKDRITKVFEACASRGIPYDEELQIITRKGRRVWVRTIGVAIRDQFGKIIKVQGGFQDISDRKIAEKKLKDAEERYRLFFQNDLTGDYLSTPEGELIDCNPAFAKMMGYSSAEEILGEKTIHFYPEVIDREEFLLKLQKEKIIENYEIELIRKDGKTIQCIENVVGFFNDQGVLTSLQGYLFDITQRKQMENSLRESELHFRTLADSGQALIWTSGLDMKCDYFNKVWLKFRGRTLEQEAGEGWTEGVHPDDMNYCLKTYVQAFERREKFSMDYRLRRHDGAYRWIQDDGSPRYNLGGEFIGYIGHCLDITERKEATKALKESERRFRTLFEKTANPILVIDKQGNYKDANLAALEFLEISKEELMQKNVSSFMPSEMNNEEVWNKHHDLWKKSGRIETSYLINGKVKTLDLTITPGSYRNKEVVFGIGIDITPQKEAELQLKKELREKVVLLREVHHRVKNNLAIISSLLNLQSRTITSPEKALEAFQNSRDRVMAMSLVHQKIYQSEKYADVDMRYYLKDMISHLYEAYAYDKNINLVYDLQEVSLEVDKAIPCALIVNELVTNAFKHAFPDNNTGKILLSLKQLENGYIRLQISDDGVGLPDEFNEKQSLGMNLVYMLSEQLHGQICSDTDKGTTFTIEFPATNHGNT